MTKFYILFSGLSLALLGNAFASEVCTFPELPQDFPSRTQELYQKLKSAQPFGKSLSVKSKAIGIKSKYNNPRVDTMTVYQVPEYSSSESIFEIYNIKGDLFPQYSSRTRISCHDNESLSCFKKSLIANVDLSDISKDGESLSKTSEQMSFTLSFKKYDQRILNTDSFIQFDSFDGDEDHMVQKNDSLRMMVTCGKHRYVFIAQSSYLNRANLTAKIVRDISPISLWFVNLVAHRNAFNKKAAGATQSVIEGETIKIIEDLKARRL
jgi:hypothetical protein